MRVRLFLLAAKNIKCNTHNGGEHQLYLLNSGKSVETPLVSLVFHIYHYMLILNKNEGKCYRFFVKRTGVKNCLEIFEGSYHTNFLIAVLEWYHFGNASLLSTYWCQKNVTDFSRRSKTKKNWDCIPFRRGLARVNLNHYLGLIYMPKLFS